MNKDKNSTEKTDFQGPISLDAIFAATSGKTDTTKVEDKKPIVQQQDTIITVKENKENKKDVTNQKAEDTNKNPIVNNNEPAPEPIKSNVVPETETEAFKTVKRLIGLGLLEDFMIQISEDDEDGTPISEFTSMSDENLEEIIKIHKQESEKNISSNYIPKEGLREHELKVIEILKKGGDLSKIAKTEEEAFKRPFEGFDMDDQNRQIDVRYTDLVHQKGLDHESAITIIDKEVKSGVIENKAKEIFDNYRKAHTAYIDKILEEQSKEKEFKELNFKENKKLLTAKLKEAGLKESVYKKVASEYGKKNESGDYALVDKLREALDNPEANHELILHLADKGLFNETFKIKAAQESQKTIVRLASRAASKGNKQIVKNTSTELESPWVKAAQKYNESLNKR